MKEIASGCGHVGFILKREIVAHLVECDVGVIDKGTWLSERIDCPHYTSQVVLAIADGEIDGGILICSTGADTSIAANKFAGVYAVVCSEPYSAQLSRRHSDTSTLVFGPRVIGLELAKMTVNAWLDAQCEGGRHQQHVEAITAIRQQRS